jgi:type IV pilus assembly protein PilW
MEPGSATDMARAAKNRRANLRERGFTLLELMIGVLIGALSSLVIAKVLAFSEGQRRTTTHGSDAQVNGALALDAIQRDAQMAGYGMSSALDALGCAIKAQFGGVDFTWTLAPVLITAGAGGAPDSIAFMGSSTSRYSLPTRVIVDHPRTAANFFTNTTVGIHEGDLMLAVPRTIDANNWCSVFNVTGLGAGGGGGGGGGGGDGGGGDGGGGGGGFGQNQVIHNSGADGPWNQAGGQTIFPDAGYPAGSYLLNLGQFDRRTYSIGAANSLQLTTFSSATATESTADLYPGIVQLKAFYGKDTDGDGVVDTYDKTAPASNAQWRQVQVVRLAVVARSAQFEREDVTAADLLWDVGTTVPVAGAADCGASKCVTLKVSALADWKRYRYKVYDVVVPLRNLLWHG